MIIGSHVSFGKNQLLDSVMEAISFKADTFMFYTGAPQNTLRKDIDEELCQKAWQLMEENNIAIKNVICHAPYIINLANNLDESKYQFSINFLKEELNRCEKLGIKYIVLHPGSSVGIDSNIALDNIVNALNIVLNNTLNVEVLLETMAGKGTELGKNLNEIKYIFDHINNKNKIGICLDTCHLNDAGYDMALFDNYLDEFNKLIPLSYIKCIHINDSKNILNSHKDRHANIGFGTIGFDNILNIVNNSRIKDIPKILETPYIGDNDEDKERLYPPYKYEIDMLRKGIFNPNIMQDIRNEYQNK